MHRLKEMKRKITDIVECQLTHPECVDTKELGEAIDMIKDLTETMYYCSIVEAMEGQNNEDIHYYNPYYRVMPNGQNNEDIRYYNPYHRVMPNDYDVYYEAKEGYHNLNPNPAMVNKERPRDSREGKSPLSRKMYMESKELHHDPATQMKGLEKYIQELSQDILEMIKSSTPEEKQVLQQKIAMLAQEIK